MIVDDLSDLKLFVVNNFVKEYFAAQDSKTRIQALTKIGEVDGVDAFKKRSEVTHIIKPLEEVEQELLRILEGVEYSVMSEVEEAGEEEIVEEGKEVSENTEENDENDAPPDA